MAEGVDLKDELSRFQIIVKVPYPVLDRQARQVPHGTRQVLVSDADATEARAVVWPKRAQ